MGNTNNSTKRRKRSQGSQRRSKPRTESTASNSEEEKNNTIVHNDTSVQIEDRETLAGGKEEASAIKERDPLCAMLTLKQSDR